MGYTVYYTTADKASTKAIIKEFHSGVNKMIKASGLDIDVEYTSKDICLNAHEQQQAHEDFHLGYSLRSRWDFCKTNRKAYTPIVFACLYLALELKIISSFNDDDHGESDYEATGKALFEALL